METAPPAVTIPEDRFVVYGNLVRPANGFGRHILAQWDDGTPDDEGAERLCALLNKYGAEL